MTPIVVSTVGVFCVVCFIIVVLMIVYCYIDYFGVIKVLLYYIYTFAILWNREQKDCWAVGGIFIFDELQKGENRKIGVR